MPVKEMDPVEPGVVPGTSGQKPVLESDGCKHEIYVNGRHAHSSFEVLQSLRSEEVLCDIKIETDDSVIVCAHKVVLVSGSQYFRSMFTSFAEGNKDIINLRELDSNILQLLLDYIYTGKIMVTEKNAMDLLPAATLLQLDYVEDVCVDFLKKKLNPSNCLRIKEFANLYNYTELLTSSEEYIKTHFLKVIEAKEFLSLCSEEVINLISRDDINVPFEEKIFECVINWIKHELDCRYDSLPKLMEHVRLSLAPQEYISIKVDKEPLIKNNPKCKDFVNEALNFHILKKQCPITIPQTIRNSPRQTGPKILLAMCDSSYVREKCYTSWYDPSTKILYHKLEMSMKFGGRCGLALIKEHLVFALGNKYSNSSSIEMLDLSSQTLQWKSTVNMLVDRIFFGVGVLDDRIYAVGGAFGDTILNTVEVFDVSIQEWRIISRMSTRRATPGVGVLNNLLYVVGGFNHSFALKSVECYDPSTDTWTSVTQMSTSRQLPGIGVLDGIMYAIGGDCWDNNRLVHCKSVEAYSPITNDWSPIADMHICRSNPSVVTFNGLLYVMGGVSESTRSESVEIYDPNTNTWTLDTLSTSVELINGAIVVDMPLYLRTD